MSVREREWEEGGRERDRGREGERERGDGGGGGGKEAGGEREMRKEAVCLKLLVHEALSY
jgi:hypothetical protein